MHVHDDPLVFAGRAMHITKAQPDGSTYPPSKNKSEAMEQKGDLLIRDLWQNSTNSVHDMRVVDTNDKYPLENTLENFLQEAERSKKNIYLEACLQQHQHFTPFVASVGGILGVEVGATLKIISSRL